MSFMDIMDSVPRQLFNVPPLAKHDLVLINGLQSSPQYNGRLATLGNMVRDRYNVFFTPPYDDEEGIRVKPTNLIWVAHKDTCAKGAMVCPPEYMFSYMLMYRDTYADFPKFDMVSIAQSIASTQNIRFEDRTVQLEKLQIDGVHHTYHAQRIFMKAGVDAMVANGKLMILFRRTLLSNAAFISYELSTMVMSSAQSSHPFDFILFVNDDYLKSERAVGFPSICSQPRFAPHLASRTIHALFAWTSSKAILPLVDRTILSSIAATCFISSALIRT